MKAAASASGGCIVALLFRPYTPAIPASQAFGGHLVQVGRYHGALFHLRIYVVVTSHRHPAGHVGRAVKSTFTELFVRLPAGHGMVRDLVIGAQDLSGPALIKIAANGAVILNDPRTGTIAAEATARPAVVPGATPYGRAGVRRASSRAGVTASPRDRSRHHCWPSAARV